MALPGMGGMGLGGRQSGIDPQQAQEQQMIKYMQAAMEACPTKTVIAGTMGFGLGGIFGVFMSSMRYDTPMSSGMPGGVGTISDLPMREQLKSGFKDMGRSAYSSAKNFGYIGAVFSGTECCIEGLRAKNDLYNGVAAGCLTGGWLAKGGGPQAVAVGCAGFAAFSAAIDAYMRMPQDDKASDPII
ncbi:Mitochondrial import inner membrane translocase subunit tim22 [Friedmanniomyces endolithicus]|uniref:Mitochondrial import inner membrane translocase subunit TIM22 n=2 Tax=Friedmanniomyces endolithicus TaxID=329885 RepID=A0AAN6KNA4_9PEZI|nr:Mitochondrial import inner membrane translocase subunit tim22 [Friedmanniomyces endolithicus]KAK0291821.1 Mitochondrial import inner membrane translocase subunit tim22 [Friedmanniomyces endolithicus]KAK0296503.1 Mitochondrial import inner membrane translocase subunit tim22 [Friedmanniomyces endolithicus]KAK0309815.1 Mitochondrial import inner membrane translocase subunit tim22 [Friedmanniomyces endolithicus]KAK0324538.1 Mitochondrial import inner membrane translocase subunit tim22 [Friedmann